MKSFLLKIQKQMSIWNLYFPKQNSTYKTIISIKSFYLKEYIKKKFHIWQVKPTKKNKIIFN